MQIKIKVTTNAKQNKIVETLDGLKVYITTAPENGKANIAVIKLLSQHYKVPKSSIEIIAGQTARIKIISINN